MKKILLKLGSYEPWPIPLELLCSGLFEGIHPTPHRVKAILVKSFMPHQKGKAWEHCSFGHKLELPILDKWVQVAIGTESPVPGLTVMGAHTAGLAAKRGAVHAKDSIDFVVTVAEAEGNETNRVKSWFMMKFMNPGAIRT